ncbi:MAG: LytTR family transcriptional regulator DNA-binding domain-containing protein [Leptospirales bacterium]|nr:LytTR family transcriptional regulator DNA-binding domain-containing protein [Leptospirales bacterium]
MNQRPETANQRRSARLLILAHAAFILIFSAALTLLLGRISSPTSLQTEGAALFAPILISVGWITTLAAGAGFYVYFRTARLSGSLRFALTLGSALLATLLGDQISKWFTLALLRYDSDPAVLSLVSGQLPGSLILTLIVCSASYLLAGNMQRTGIARAADGAERTAPDAGAPPQLLLLRADGVQHAIPVRSVHYLSAHRTHTVVHAEDRDFEIAMVLKRVLAAPGASFLRIHKRYAIRLDLLRQLQRAPGGGLQAVLADSDDTILPVGRAYVASLRQALRAANGAGALPPNQSD